MGGEGIPSLESSQSLAAKRERTGLTLTELQDNIVRMVVDNINERADGLKKKVESLEALIKINT